MNKNTKNKADTRAPELEDMTMPSLGASMKNLTLTQWLVKEGDHVESGDIIAEIETQNGAINMGVYSSGIIAEILVEPFREVFVGTVLVRLALNVVSQKNPMPTAVLAPIPALKATETLSARDKSIALSKQATGANATDIKASPIIRRLAKEQQLNLTGIKGSGPQGAISLNDLSTLLKEKIKNGSENIKTADISEQNMRNAIAVAMAKSKQEIPHLYLSLEVDITNAELWLKQRYQTTSSENQVLLLALLLKALANALVKYPKLNGFYQSSLKAHTFEKNNNFEQANEIHIGKVISLRPGGLVVPAIHDVDQLSISEISQSIQDITKRSRNGHLRNSELMDATITVTNMGEHGVDSVFGIIYPPQVAIVGFGKVRKIVKIVNDNIENASVLTVSLSADHRVIDGMLAAKFLNCLAKNLQQPESL